MYKVGVIADIHGNIEALEAVLSYMEEAGCDEYLLLGDYISDGASPRETMDRLYKLMDAYPCTALRGNREEYMLSQKRVREGREIGPVWIPGSGSGSLLYTYEKLNQRDFAFFDSLPITFLYESRVEGLPRIRCCHGSPDDARHLLQIGAQDTCDELERADADYLIAAHTHIQGSFSRNGKLYMNTGSLGLAIDAPGYAHAIILSCNTGDEVKKRWEPEFLEIPYDVNKAISKMFTTGFYDMAPWFVNNNIHTLRTGIDVTPILVESAKKLKIEAEGADNWPDIAEMYYEKAAGELGMPNYAEVVVTADASEARCRAQKKLPVIGVCIDGNYSDFGGVSYVTDDIDVSDDYKRLVLARCYDFPYTIAETPRTIIRETVPEDLDEFIPIYEDEYVRQFVEPLYSYDEEKAYLEDYRKNVYSFFE